MKNNEEIFDYTEWQRKYFDSMTTEDIKEDINKYVKENPYNGNAVCI